MGLSQNQGSRGEKNVFFFPRQKLGVNIFFPKLKVKGTWFPTNWKIRQNSVNFCPNCSQAFPNVPRRCRWCRHVFSCLATDCIWEALLYWIFSSGYVAGPTAGRGHQQVLWSVWPGSRVQHPHMRPVVGQAGGAHCTGWADTMHSRGGTINIKGHNESIQCTV